jgi:hypothetical protein
MCFSRVWQPKDFDPLAIISRRHTNGSAEDAKPLYGVRRESVCASRGRFERFGEGAVRQVVDGECVRPIFIFAGVDQSSVAVHHSRAILLQQKDSCKRQFWRLERAFQTKNAYGTLVTLVSAFFTSLVRNRECFFTTLT